MNPAKTIQTRQTRNALLAACVFGAAAASPNSAHAEATGLLVGKLTGETAMDRAWSAATLYKNEDNPILEEFSLQGMLQLQSAWVNPDGHSSDMSDIKARGAASNKQYYWGDDVEVRRIRAGFKTQLFHDIKFAGLFDLDPNFSYGKGDTDLTPGLFKQIYTMYMTYALDKQLNLSVGKTEVNSTREFEISSKEILPFERSLVDNMVKQPELTGVWADGKEVFGTHFFYGAGLFSNESSNAFASSAPKNGAVYLAKVGYDYTSLVENFASKATTSFIWTHSTHPGESAGSNSTNVTSKFGNVYSWNTDIENGPFGLLVEGIYADGVNASDVRSISIMPSYYVIPGKLQVVLRGQLAASSQKNGLTLYSRYEGATGLPGEYGYNTTGSTYSAAYLGMNYFLNAHKAKFMAGMEYADMAGYKNGVAGQYDGITYLCGFRGYF
jgi:hypothetical protein